MCGWHRNDTYMWYCFRTRNHSGPCLTAQRVSETQIAVALAPDQYWLLGPDLLDDIEADIRTLLG